MIDKKTKKALILLTVGIVTIVVATFSVTYAYFSSNKNVDNSLNVSMKTGAGSYTFVVTTENDLDFNLTDGAMYSKNVSLLPVAQKNANVIISLTSPDFLSTTVCSYDLIWQWLSTDQYTNSTESLPYIDSKTSIEYKNQFSVYASRSMVSDTGNFNYTDGDMNETDLSKLSWDKPNGEVLNSAVLHTGQIASRSTDPTVVTWNIVGSIYNLPIDQNAWASNVYSAKIYVDNVKCKIYDQTPESIE